MKNEEEIQEVKDKLVEGDRLNGEMASRELGDFSLSDESVTQHDEALEAITHETKAIDYSTFSKQEFVDLLKDLSTEKDFRKVDAIQKEIRPFVIDIREKERSEALSRFIEAGGVKEDFEFKLDELDNSFDATYKLIRDRRNQFYKGIEDQKAESLKKKNEILDKLRTLLDSEDSENSFHHFKELQHAWKNSGPVAPALGKNLWASYTALIDRFYDNRSIYFELKELDRKRNLEHKLEICAKAERLLSLERIKDAVKELNDLHHEFKHIGPVPKEDQENLWQRFKASSDAIYARRDAFLVQLQSELKSNLQVKDKLMEELVAVASFQSDRIKEWNAKTQEVLDIQKKWEAVGAIPRSKARESNKKFWSAFKTFFSNKNQFFKKLDEVRDKNLQLKNEIVKKANELRESLDWEKTANDLKELQRQWKEVGPVPEKYREKIYVEFKKACDHFFEQRRTQFDKAEKEQEDNLLKKVAICEKLEGLIAEKTATLEVLNDLQKQFNSIGFVPKHAMVSIKNRFAASTEKFFASMDNVSTDEKDRAMLEIQLNNLKNDPDAERKIFQKEQTIRKKITKVENDLAVLINNLEFFGRSKNAEKLKEEFNEKIKESNGHLIELKGQLKMLKTVS